MLGMIFYLEYSIQVFTTEFKKIFNKTTIIIKFIIHHKYLKKYLATI